MFHVTSGLTGSEQLYGSEYLRTVHYPVLLTAVPSAMLPYQLHLPYFPAHKMRDFFIRNFRKNDECILILVIYWKKTGLLHTKISKHNIIYSSQKPRKSSSLPLKSSSWLFSLDVSLSSYKMSSSLPSSTLLMSHFLKDFTVVSLLIRCQ